MAKFTLSHNDILVFIAGVFVFLFPVVPSYLDFRIHENFGLSIQRVLVFVAFMVFSACLVSGRELCKNLIFVISRNKFVALFLGGYIFLRFLSYFYNPSVYSLFLLVNEVLMNAFVLLFFASVLISVEHVQRIVRVSIFAGLLVSIVVFVEIAMGGNFLSTLADVSTTAGKVAAEVKNRDGYLRAQGTFEHPLALAQYLLALLLMLFSRPIFGCSRVFLVLAAVVLFLAAYSARVRTFYVCLLFGVVFYLFVVFLWGGWGRLKMNARLGCLFLFAPIICFLVFYKLYDIVFLGSEAELSSTMTRFSQFYNGMLGICERPFLGHGIGGAREVIVDIGIYHPDGFPIWNEAIDSFYLGLALESGIPALFCYVMFFLGSMISGVVLYKRKNESLAIRVLALSVSTSLVGVFISMMVLSIFTVLPFVFVLIGLNCALSAISARG